jgi:hypothetical protein
MSACSRGFGVLLLCVVVVVSPKSVGHAEGRGLPLRVVVVGLRDTICVVRFAFCVFCFCFCSAWRNDCASSAERNGSIFGRLFVIPKVFYSESKNSGMIIMDCIYLNCIRTECRCHAIPMRPNETVVFYKPTEEEMKQFCKSSSNFGICPRFKAFKDTFKSEYR